MTSQQNVSTFQGRLRARGRHAVTRQSALVPTAQAAVAQASLVDVPAEAAPLAPVDERAAAPRRGLARLLNPLTAILAVQAALSLTLIWSNTAFTDEADYLWIGRLVLGSWLHGRSWPTSYGEKLLPGSPLVYPPIGALADSIGGLAGARIVSLIFMLGATVLLYGTASKLFGWVAATFGAAVWVLTEPVIRLAFATPDPLAVFLVALSAWLIVEAGHRRHHGELVAASAAALALANATTYSSTVIDPVLFGFALFFWRTRLQPRQAANSTAWLAAAFFVFLGVVLTVSKSWTGFSSMAFGRGTGSHQNIVLVLIDIWSYSGLIIVLGLIATVIAMSSGGAGRAGLIAVLASAAFIVPAVQLINQTAAVLDRRLACGIWFAAIAAGLACANVIRWLPGARKSLTAALVAVVIIGYLGFASWQSASGAFRGWPNSKSFVAALAPVAATSKGLIFVAGQEHVAEYYTRQGADWTRWSTGDLPLSPPRKPTVAYYLKLLRSTNYGLIVLFYSTSFTTGSLPTGVFTGADPGQTAQKVVDSAGGSAEPGLGPLTAALSQDHAYRLVKSGSYDSANSDASYAIWQKVSKK